MHHVSLKKVQKGEAMFMLIKIILIALLYATTVAHGATNQPQRSRSTKKNLFAETAKQKKIAPKKKARSI